MCLFVVCSSLFIMLQIFFWGVLHDGFKYPVEVGKTGESAVKSNGRNVIHAAGG